MTLVVLQGVFYTIREETIQERRKISEKGMNIEKISLKFKNMISKGNVNEALKLLMENMLNGILPLNDKTLKMLK